MKALPILFASVVALTFLSGCLGGGTKTEAGHSHEEGAAAHSHGDMDHGAHMDLSLLDGFKIEYKGCSEAGGVSLYNLQDGSTPPPGQSWSRVQGPTKDFNRTSIQDDTGNPAVASYWRPIMSKKGTTGIWHTSLVCKSHVFNGKHMGAYEGGWVGVRVEPPAWDTSGIKRQYFVADLSFNQGDIVSLIHEATGLHASRNLDSKVDFPAPNVLHTLLDDEDHGVFQTDGKMKDWTPKDSMDKMRFWMLINPGGHGHAGSEGTQPKCECIPIAFDLDSTSGKYLVFDGTGYLSHSRTDAHGNEPVAHGNVGGMAFLGFDRTMTVGTIPDVVLTETWLH